jgi:GTP-binding protein
VSAERTERAPAAPPAPDFSEEEIAAGRALFRGPCDFVKGVVDVAGLPEPRTLEVAFAGRSNVGKSSLINALIGRKALARTSNTPGRTREINFFALGDDVFLVDLPGYGYARAPKRQVAGWQQLIRDYLKGRQALRRVFLLVDARHGLKASDDATLDLMDQAAVSYQAVLTKADKLKAAALDEVLAATARALAKHPAAHPEVLATSAVKGRGLDELRATIAALLAQ